ncbi:hypothetical protein JRQ81_017600, partial [Phrynocephalus forsythii]
VVVKLSFKITNSLLIAQGGPTKPYLTICDNHILETSPMLNNILWEFCCYFSTVHLFVTFQDGALGAQMSPQHFAKWLINTITLRYHLAKQPLYPPMVARSILFISSYSSFSRGVQLQDICAASTWAQRSGFVIQY